MRPLRGVVTELKDSILVIKIESGLTIRIPKVSGLNVGKQVQVAYDFTEGKVVSVSPKEKHQQVFEIAVKEPEPIVVEEGEHDDSDILVLDSGALPLLVEGFWDSGILELSRPDCGGLWDLDDESLEIPPSDEDCDWHDPQV